MTSFFTYIVCLIATLFLMACSTTKKVVVDKSLESDSVVITHVTETTFITDTTWIELPAQTAERTTQDSSSFLENDYANSTAKINPDGTLYHDLILLPKTIPKTFERPIVTKTNDIKKSKKEKDIKTVTVEKPIPLLTRIFATIGKILSLFFIIGLILYLIRLKLR